MAKISVGNVFWNLRADGSELPKDIQRAISKSKKQMQRVGSQFKSAGKNMTAGLTAPILGIGLVSGKMAADFDDAMREVNSLIGLPQQGFKDLKDEIRTTSAALGLDLKDGAAAAYQAISAGIPQEELTSFLAIAGQAAVAGVSNLETSVGLLTKTMDAYGDKSVSAKELSDQLFATVKNGVTDFDQLASALPNASSMAAALGVESKELLGILARTSKVSDSTAGAVTRISSAMGAILKPSKDMSDLLDTAGIANAKAEIEANGLTNTLLKLRKAAKGNSTVIAKAFGRKEAILLMLDLAENTDQWRENIDAVTGSTGAMVAAFEEIDKGPGRGFAKLSVAMSSLAVQIGDQIIPAILPLVYGLSSIATELGNLDPAVLQVGLAFAGLLAVAGPLLIAFGAMITVAAPIIPFLTGAAGAAGGLTGAFGLVAGVLTGPVGLAIIAVIGVGALLIANWDKVKAGAIALVQAALVQFENWKVRNAAAIAAMSTAWASIKESLVSIGGSIQTALGGIITKLDEFLEPIGGMKGAWEIAFVFIKAGWDQIATTVSAAFTLVAGVFSELAAVISGQKTIWEGLGGVISHALDAAKAVALGWRDQFVKIFSSIDLKAIGIQIMKGFAQGLKDTAMMPINAAKNVAKDLTNGVKDLFGIKSPSRVFMGIGGNVMDGLAAGLHKSKGAVSAAMESAGKIKTAFKGGLAGIAMGGMVGTASADQGISGLAGQDSFSQEGFGSIAGQYIPEEAQILNKYSVERDMILAETKITEQQRTDLLRSSEAARSRALQGDRKDFLGQLATLQGHHDQRIATIGKAASVAQAVIQRKGAMYEAAMNTKAMAIGAYKAMAPIPVIGPVLGIAAAGAALAFGASQMAGMNSAPSFEGGGSTGEGSRIGGLDGRGGFAAMLHPNEDVIDKTKGQGSVGVTVIQNFHDATPERLREMAHEIEERAKAGVINAVTNQGPERDAFRGI